MTPVPETRVQCPFCLLVNVVDEESTNCLNCKLNLEDIAKDSSATLSENKTVDTQPTDPVQIPQPVTAPEELHNEEPVEPSFAELRTAYLTEHPAADQPSQPDGNHPEPQPRRRGRIIVIAAAACTLLLAGGATLLLIPRTDTAPMAASQTSKPTAEPELTVDVPGWDTTPTWVRDVSVAEATESRDGTYLGVIDDQAALVLDAAAGDTVASQPLSDDATRRVYQAGDMFLVIDGDTVYVWADTPDDASSDSDASSGWREVSLPDDATLMLRGDSVIVMTEVGESYDVITPTGDMTRVKVPLVGAVPVAAADGTIVWGTNRGVAYVTDHKGKILEETKLKAPKGAKKIARWMGGDADHVWVAWEKGKKRTLAVHSLANGKAKTTHAIAKDDLEAVPTGTRDGSTAELAGLLIHRDTGTITKIEDAITTPFGDGFLINTADGYSHLVADGTSTGIDTPDDVAPLAVTSEGNLIVSVDGKTASLKRDNDATAQEVGSSERG